MFDTRLSRTTTEHFLRVLAQKRLAVEWTGRFILETDHRCEMLAAIVRRHDGAALQEIGIDDLLGHGALGSLALWIYSALAGIVVHTLPAIFYVLLREEKEGATAGQVVAALD